MQSTDLFQVLLALVVIVGMARLVGAAVQLAGQPAVIGEIVGGVVLGPSVFGRIAPGLAAAVFPPTVAPVLNVIAQLGVMLYMFLVGLELDLRILRQSGAAMLAIASASIVVPFALGMLLAIGVYPHVATVGVPPTAFVLFVGVSLAVTAFPVLARILSDQGVSPTSLGTLTLGCAAVGDVAAWSLLALAVSAAQARVEAAVATALFSAAYVVGMLVLGRPVLTRIVEVLDRRERMTDGGMAILAVTLLLSALTTEIIGIHAIFGAFLLGAIIPRESRVAEDLAIRIEGIVRVLFLPVFFAYTGLRTQVGLLSTGEDWLLCGLIIVVATVGKWCGSAIAARIGGLRWRDASAVGALMNARGLVELIVLNIGLDLGIISPGLFAMLVLMALATTIMATPLFQLLTRSAPWR